MTLNEQATQPQETSYPEIFTDEHGEYCLISLTRGQFAKVDPADYRWLMQWKWQAHRVPKIKDKFYASRRVGLPSGRQTVMYMSRQIVDTPQGLDVDHENSDSLDNRRQNLRLATKSQNSCNIGLRSDNKSGFKGVGWNPYHKKWAARIGINGKRITLGYFSTPEDAFIAYKAAADKLHVDFARY